MFTDTHICKIFNWSIIWEVHFVSSMCKYRITFTLPDSIALFLTDIFNVFSQCKILDVTECILTSSHLEALLCSQDLLRESLKCFGLSYLGCSICQRNQPHNYSPWQTKHLQLIEYWNVYICNILYMHLHKNDILTWDECFNI